MIVRLATAADLEALVEFNQAMALETEGKRLDPETLGSGVAAVFDDDSKGFYVVADNDGTVAAGLMVTFEWSDWRNSWFWWIQSVYVLPRYRGQGIYGQLYEYVKRLAAAKGNVCGFRLYVENSNLTARGVYEKVGMRESHYRMYEE
jgi:GNAT superfamily N-acetyltransferase